MKIYEFIQLNKDDQYEAVFEMGIHVSTFFGKKYHHHLYSLDSFYVELLYDPSTFLVMDFFPFEQGVHLDKYLPEL